MFRQIPKFVTVRFKKYFFYCKRPEILLLQRIITLPTLVKG